MTKEFTHQTLSMVYGAEFSQDYHAELNIVPSGGRTPLHVNFSNRTNHAPAEVIAGEDLNNPEVFNAIGSKRLDSNKHRPVIDVDGGVKVTNRRNVTKAVLWASREGRYTPDSELREVLGDYGIDFEPFEHPRTTYDNVWGTNVIKGVFIGAVVLRSPLIGVFEAVDSTTEDHGHLYIQQEFEDSDHETLIRELGAVGIVSPAWRMLTEQEGMSIVRTPWTEKEITHRPS
jgi:hypothetical protein